MCSFGVKLILPNESSQKICLYDYITLNLKAQRISYSQVTKYKLGKIYYNMFVHFGGCFDVQFPI